MTAHRAGPEHSRLPRAISGRRREMPRITGACAVRVIYVGNTGFSNRDKMKTYPIA